MSFWCLQFSQKKNENNSTWGTIVVKSNFFVQFLGELKIPKRHFEINWPLASEFICLFHFKITHVLYAIVFIVRSKLWVYRNSVWLEELRSNSWGKWSWPEHRLEEKNLEQFSRPHEMSVRTCLKFKMKPKKRRERSVFRPAESLKMHSWNSWI